MSITTAHWRERAAALAAGLRASGAARTDHVTSALAAVPRHVFIPGYYSGDTRITTSVDAAPSAELLDLAYRNRGVMTHRPGDEAGTYSSASQPSVVARMLEAADLAPGDRVLEIGAGTGYNAALIHHITGAPVTTVEVSPVVAEEARRALSAAGITGVHVHTGDGLLGYPADGPADGPFDRVLVTCGVSGIAAAWLEQLAPGGAIIAPFALGGLHPLTRVTVASGQARARLLASADFMAATGLLYGRAWPSPAVTSTVMPAPDPAARRAVTARLDPYSGYVDLWLYLAICDARTTCVGGEHAGCALIDSGDPGRVVYVRPDGTLLPAPGAEHLSGQVAQHIADWEARGRPALSAWASGLGASGDVLHVPTGWDVQGPG